MAELNTIRLNIGGIKDYGLADTGARTDISTLQGYFTDKTSQLATTTAHGFMSSTDKTKLDGIEAEANKTGIATTTTLGAVKVGTNLSIDTDGVLSAVDTTYEDATTSVSGLMSATDKTKLDDLAVDSQLVHKTGAETIGGVKTFSDGITANVTGNADTATKADKLTTARAIKLEGVTNGTVDFDGSAAVTITTTFGDLYDLNISEKVSDLGSIDKDTTLNGESASVFILTLNANNLTLTPSFTKAGCKTITVIINNPSTYAVNWGGTIKWPTGTEPTLTANTAMITFLYANSVWYGISVTDLQ